LGQFCERNPNEVLVFGPNGKTVRARTANQKLMVTSSEKNDVVLRLDQQVPVKQHGGCNGSKGLKTK
jgi:hypothetical protein